MNDVIKKILACGIQAPSGENCQPWKFVVKSESDIELWNVPDRDLSLYNFGQYGSYVAHGALLENISIASSHLGYAVQIELFPDPTKEELVARLRFSAREAQPQELYDAIYARATNRKAYAPDPLTENEKQEILSCASSDGSIVVRLTEDKHEKKAVAHAVSANDEMVLANPFIHNFFFSHVRWTPEESLANPSGFYLPTLELAPPQLVGFKMFRNWKFASILNRFLGISKLVAKENAQTFVRSSAMGAVLIPSATPEQFVLGGRVIQRVWLKATRMGLSFQPLVGGSFLILSIRADCTEQFSEDQIDRLSSADKDLTNIFHVENRTIAMVFRLGKGGEPSARSPRFPLEYFMSSQ